jgi:hypothetical protein
MIIRCSAHFYAFAAGGRSTLETHIAATFPTAPLRHEAEHRKLESVQPEDGTSQESTESLRKQPEQRRIRIRSGLYRVHS